MAAAVCALVALVPASLRGQGALSALEAEADQIQRAARASVVTVISRSEVPGRPGSSEPLRLRVRTRVGSGVAVGATEILTAASVVLDAQHVWVRTSNNLQVEASVAGVDPVANLALLRVANLRLPVLRWSEGEPAREGEWAVAIGTARLGRDRFAYTIGTVSYRHQAPRLALVQLTNRAYPGFGGGAVVDARGELMGILQGELEADSPWVGSEAARTGGTSFMLPVASARPVWESLRSAGRVRYGYLGVSTRAASVLSDTQKGLSVPIGAQVESVISGGPAEQLGLRRGDLIVGFEGARVEYPTQLARWVAATRPGSSVEFVWVRNDLQQSGRVVLSESSDARPEWAIAEPTGMSPAAAPDVADLKRQVRRLNREIARLKGDSSSSR